MKVRVASASDETSASSPAIARTGERTPSQATTRSASTAPGPSGASVVTPTTRSPSRTSPVTVCSWRTGTPSARAPSSRPTSMQMATGIPSAPGAMSQPSARTRPSRPRSSRASKPWKPSMKGRFWWPPAGERSSTTGS